MRILFLADVYGAPGVSAIESKLRMLRAELELDCVVINAENAADGAGLTPKLAERLLAAGARGGAGTTIGSSPMTNSPTR